VLGLIFLKFISDTFTKHQPTVLARVSDPDSDYCVGDDPADHQAALVAIDNDNDTLRGKLDRRFGRA
jgi:type I restriction-modification system DNA methylase subunit